MLKQLAWTSTQWHEQLLVRGNTVGAAKPRCAMLCDCGCGCCRRVGGFQQQQCAGWWVGFLGWRVLQQHRSISLQAEMLQQNEGG